MILQPFLEGTEGEIMVPGSKSITNRALLLAAMAEGKSILRGALISEDSFVLQKALEDWGIHFENNNTDVIVQGCGGKFPKGNHRNFLGNAGTAMRFLSAAAGLVPGEVVLFGKERMHERPIEDLIKSLSSLGVNIHSQERNGYPPLCIQGSGEILGGECDISGSVSSQFFSAILLSGSQYTKGVSITLSTELVSEPYAKMTKDVLQQWNVEVRQKENAFFIPPQKISSREYTIEGDTSSAAHIFSLAIAAGGTIGILNFPEKSIQGDAKYTEILQAFGADVWTNERGTYVKMENEIQAIGEKDLGDIPDAGMNAITLAALAKGKSCFFGLKTLRVKECDRIFALQKNLEKIGVSVKSGEDFLEIDGHPDRLHGGEIECFDDHRIAMSFASLGAKIPRIIIDTPDCVGKTFPDFWKVFESCRKCRN